MHSFFNGQRAHMLVRDRARKEVVPSLPFPIMLGVWTRTSMCPMCSQQPEQ